MHVQKRDKGIGTKSGLAAETGNNERGDQGETKCGGLAIFRCVGRGIEHLSVFINVPTM